MRRNKAIVCGRRGRETSVHLREREGKRWRGFVIVEAEGAWRRRRGCVSHTGEVAVRERAEVRTKERVRSRISLTARPAGR